MSVAVTVRCDAQVGSPARQCRGRARVYRRAANGTAYALCGSHARLPTAALNLPSPEGPEQLRAAYMAAHPRAQDGEGATA